MEYYDLILIIGLCAGLVFVLVKIRKRTGLGNFLIRLDMITLLIMATYFVVSSIFSILF